LRTNSSNINSIKNGGIGIMATDTLYGLVGTALNEKTVGRIYQLKKRRPDKPFIILISDTKELSLFDIQLEPQMRQRLVEYWPGQVSVILPCKSKKFEYLHRGSQTLAFRLPAKQTLRKLLAKTGPLVAPSANPEGMDPAANLKQAKQYFGNKVDFYIRGKTSTKPSKIIRLIGDKVYVIRI